ncbi:Rieske 2Fe-2S domain-containing protein [Kitasatospora sp. NPDC086801]|uniref:Rieske 2Fe-2S domain-containing protein n=1 Tax=Kitasatospora sp. NPDC086801 TaxID=3364066 RepID=UPI0038272301
MRCVVIPWTPAPRTAQATAPRLPYPDGWFALAASHELKAGKVLTRRLMGEDVVLYRTASGAMRAVRPYCPHLGAHLGHGATAQGDNLRPDGPAGRDTRTCEGPRGAAHNDRPQPRVPPGPKPFLGRPGDRPGPPLPVRT